MTAIHTYLSVGLDFDVSIPQKFLSAVEIVLMASKRLDTLQVECLTFPDHPFRIPLIRYDRVNPRIAVSAFPDNNDRK
ncbi:hypothetical protein T12_9369 [Trichinella patagoniensis]|uniref:Uncharacterized protein n=1 Tax=Trichinella patagoniensis TaxID=990121 RepID=A0A0V1ADE5_9BILA|nr:hypothetical protein T12_9369 [Trichinella patagoniensis]